MRQVDVDVGTLNKLLKICKKPQKKQLEMFKLMRKSVNAFNGELLLQYYVTLKD